ncbi:helix-turn-helix domain-containing protein [Rhodococcus hoagii]|nr:helix-turn-helix domain-containing protein [Prescottella equi]
MHDSRRQCDSDGGESVPPCPSRVRSSPPQGASRRKRALSLRSRTSFRVPYNTIRRWETGNSAPAPDLLARVAEVLGVDVDALAVIQDAAVSLASWRTKKGFTQEEVAAALDMSPRPTRDSNGANARSPTVTPPPWQAFSGSSRSKSDPRGCARTNAPAARAAKPDNTAPPT